MSTEHTVTATFAPTRWEETDIDPTETLARLTRASCSQTYDGGIKGRSTLEYLMVYNADGRATFAGLERIVGSVAGREGSFVLQHDGVYDQGVATMTLRVVAGAGTGDLAGLRGEGTFASGHAERYEVTLQCRFNPPSPTPTQ
ncbi:MAG: DUF3224 domain-containing protein [Planctomycetota bacterium]